MPGRYVFTLLETVARGGYAHFETRCHPAIKLTTPPFHSFCDPLLLKPLYGASAPWTTRACSSSLPLTYASRRQEVFAEWKNQILRLADLPNIYMKLCGLGMPVVGLEYVVPRQEVTSETLAGAWRPFLDVVVCGFGPRRCMFESNFPVDKLTVRYDQTWN